MLCNRVVEVNILSVTVHEELWVKTWVEYCSFCAFHAGTLLPLIVLWFQSSESQCFFSLLFWWIVHMLCFVWPLCSLPYLILHIPYRNVPGLCIFVHLCFACCKMPVLCISVCESVVEDYELKNVVSSLYFCCLHLLKTELDKIRNYLRPVL